MLRTNCCTGLIFRLGRELPQGGSYLKEFKLKKIMVISAGILSLSATAALADPAPQPNQGCVAQATLAYKVANGPSSTGPAISDRNTNPENTYYADLGFTGRGDEVSTLAQSCNSPN